MTVHGMVISAPFIFSVTELGFAQNGSVRIPAQPPEALRRGNVARTVVWMACQSTLNCLTIRNPIESAESRNSPAQGPPARTAVPSSSKGRSPT